MAANYGKINMPILRRQFLLSVFSLCDIAILATALYTAVLWEGVLTPLSVLADKRIQVHTTIGIVAVLALWRLTLRLLGLYQSKRLSPRLAEIVDLLKASVAATVLLALAAYVFQIQTITTAVLLRFLLVAIPTLVASRIVLRQSLNILRRHGHNQHNLLIVGTNRRAVACANTILARPEFGYKLVGFIDDEWISPLQGEETWKNPVADIAGFRTYLRSHVIDEVIVALPIKSFYEQEDEILQICQEHGVVVRLLTDFFGATTASTEVTQLGTEPFVSFYTIPTDGVGLRMKRVLDILGSMLLLATLSPLMLAAYLLVKLDSDGPAIFSQERIGLNKRRFRILKFRTMTANAEALQLGLEPRNEAQGPVFKIKNDPRITGIGKLLRKTSIDELPQLFNVFKGDMSLVGPRPLPVRDYTGFNKDWQRRRFSVRPGITCLWQVSGRSSISFDQWMRLDMEYIDRWSFWLDLKILARTIPAVVRGSGAA